MEEDTVSQIVTIIIIILGIILLVWIFLIPVYIAKKRDLAKNEIRLIRILTWCSLLSGITWFIALMMSIFYSSDNNEK